LAGLNWEFDIDIALYTEGGIGASGPDLTLSLNGIYYMDREAR
jgi:hypothetical protein